MTPDETERLREAIGRTSARLRHGNECQEVVTRKGVDEPCANRVVALRDYPVEDRYYPVCARHTRGFCLPLVDPEDAETLIAWAHRMADGGRP